MKESFWKNIHYGRVVVWNDVNRKIIQCSESSILPSVHFSIHPFLQIILVLKSVVRQGIESMLSPKLQRRPFAFSSVYILRVWVYWFLTLCGVPDDGGPVGSEGPDDEELVLVLLEEEDGHHPDAVQDQEGHHHLTHDPHNTF